MRHARPSTRRGALVVSIGGGSVAVLVAATAAVATTSSGAAIHGCVANRSHVLSVPAKGKKCPSGTTALTWSSKGPRGAAGIPGAAGARGQAGAQGPDGAAGPAGPVGPQGAAGRAGRAGAQGATGKTGSTGAQGPAGLIHVYTSVRSTQILVAAKDQQYTVVSTPVVPAGDYLVSAVIVADGWNDAMACWIGGNGSDTTGSAQSDTTIDTMSVNQVVTASGGHRIAIVCDDYTGGGGTDPVAFKRATVTAIPVDAVTSTTN
jgi:hypothetical protein